MRENCWLPKLEYFEDYGNDWDLYESVLYKIFRDDFIDDYPLYDNLQVRVKYYPKEYNKESAFFHLTCKNYEGTEDRNPDLRRCERLRWIRAFIENSDCSDYKCDECEGVRVWSEPYKSRERVHLLLEEERYLVILEKRSGYYLLITAFYLNYDNSLKKQLKHYEQYGKRMSI